jgi:hypothetical protein
VGKAALSGQTGIISVQNGWQGRNEVNNVVYDPGLISMEQIEELLINSGTYIRTMSWQGLGKKKMEK